MDTIRGRSERILVVESPPRHGKSEHISRYAPAWYLGRYPDHHVLLTSYGDSLARNFGRDARDLLHAHRGWFGIAGVRQDVKAANEWRIVGPITGRGANLAIIDDPIKNAEEAISETVRERIWDWFRSTLFTRLEPDAVIVIVMTRWHEHDLVGKLLAAQGTELAREMNLTIRRLTFRAICEDPSEDPLGREVGEPLWPERLSLAELKTRQAVLAGYWWNSLYQQRPGQYGSSEWPDEYFRDIFADAWPEAFECSCITWDPSKGKNARAGDYSAVVWMGLARGLLWIDAEIERKPITEMCSRLIAMHRASGGQRVGVEGNSFQELVGSELDRVCEDESYPPLPISLINNSTNKQLRISRLGPYLARKKFRVRRSPGGQRLVDQLKAFPFGEHDDGPDALEMATRLIGHVTGLKE
jgi:predicted phage terminase large subunit-like protein